MADGNYWDNAAFGTTSPAETAEKPLSMWDKLLGGVNSLSPGDEHVLFKTASPLVNITGKDIDRAINVAMSAGPGTIARAGGEKIVSAATKFDGKIYEGQTHADAYQKYRNETKKTDADAGAAYGGDGFLTNTNRFVDREEAQRIVDSASPNIDPANRRTTAQRQLYAEQLKPEIDSATPLAAGLGF